MGVAVFYVPPPQALLLCLGPGMFRRVDGTLPGWVRDGGGTMLLVGSPGEGGALSLGHLTPRPLRQHLLGGKEQPPAC